MYPSNLSSLEIAAEELRLGYLRSAEAQASLQTQEESTIYAQILHFINLIMNFRVPLSAAASMNSAGGLGQGVTGTMGGDPSFNGSSSDRQAGGGGGGGGAQNARLLNNHVADRRDLQFARCVSLQ